MSRLTSTIVVRILLFYVLSVLLVVAIVPWTEIEPRLIAVRRGARRGLTSRPRRRS